METTEDTKESVASLWKAFLEENPTHENKSLPASFYFCDNEIDANECAELVVKGIKQATATSLWWFEKNKEKLPQLGDFNIVTNWEGRARAVIKTTKIVATPYDQITAEFAGIEGEGDKSLSYWQKVHEAYYVREMQPYGENFDKNMTIICEYFETVFVE